VSLLCSHIFISANGELVVWGCLGPGGLDSDWIIENERDWETSGLKPLEFQNHRAPKAPIHHYLMVVSNIFYFHPETCGNDPI